MKVLVVGGGAREHAILHSLRASSRVRQLHVAPGNGGTGDVAVNVPIRTHDLDALVRFAAHEAIDLTVVGPEAPLAAGLVDLLESRGLLAFGPRAEGARIEGSKAWAKRFLDRHGVPTAPFRVFEDAAAAHDWVMTRPVPMVVKADGLAAGKGVVVASTREEAIEAIDGMMSRREFGDAGATVVIEDCLSGEELSVLAISDGRDYRLLPAAQDHKRVGEGDRGPNTGGMGAYAPAPAGTPALLEGVKRTIIAPVIAGLAAEGISYRGVLYFGLMLTPSGPQVLEINCRFGDPETQAILPLLRSDLVDLLEGSARGSLDGVSPDVHPGAAISVVLASGGYPGSHRIGLPVRGVAAAATLDDVMIFHAGTARDDASGELVTAGGRVLAVTARGADLESAAARAYEAAALVSFDGMIYRRDIGARAMGGATRGA